MRQANTPDGSDQYALALHGLSLPDHATVVAHRHRGAVLAAHEPDLGAPAQEVRTHAAQFDGKW